MESTLRGAPGNEGALGPWSHGALGPGAVRGPPRGRSLGRARVARAEPAHTCGRRAGAGRERAPHGLALGARHRQPRACLPAHVGVIFKWNVVLAAQQSGGRVGPPALAGGRGGARSTASQGAAPGTARLSPLRASNAVGGSDSEASLRVLRSA